MSEVNLILGDCLKEMRGLEDNSVDCCITSPPYWGLRDYGTAKWEGGSVDCEHTISSGDIDPKKVGQERVTRGERNKCIKCGAIRIDSQLGLEKTPEEYVANMVNVFREVKRVLKDDGTLWLNLGDSYAGNREKSGDAGPHATCGNTKAEVCQKFNKVVGDLKPKDLVGIPWRVAFALQADGWYLRQDIIWHKPNPMPESVTDRCTKAHEYIFLLAKSQKYYFDNEAIKEPSVSEGSVHVDGNEDKMVGQKGFETRPSKTYVTPATRNKRSVWTVATKPFKEAHFATFPEDLIRPCVLAGCPKGGVILDPFSGAGTTGVVAKRNGRNFIGLELNPVYLEMARKRIDVIKEQLELI